ncbi:MAG: hypothetical protein U1A78_39155 [Polyangia bacterium]
MSQTLTRTETYTRADVYKAFEKLRSDYRLAARTTGLMKEDEAAALAEDVVLFAAGDYLSAVHLVLRQASGAVVCAEEYLITQNASGLTDSRPGGCIWPPTPGGSLEVIIVMSRSWYTLTDSQRAQFSAGLYGTWGPTHFDTSYAGLTRNPSRDYVSNAYGLRRSSIRRSGG